MPYQFQPGPLSAAAAAYLSRLARDVDRANRLAVTPPLTISEAGGNKVIAVGDGAGDGAGEVLYVRITGGTDPGPYTGVVAVQTSPGVFADKTPTETVEDIYRRPSNLTTPDIAVDQHVECWASPTVSGTYEAHPWGAMEELTSSTCLPLTLSVTCAPGGLVVSIDGVNVTLQAKARDLKVLSLTTETPCPT